MCYSKKISKCYNILLKFNPLFWEGHLFSMRLKEGGRLFEEIR